LRRKKIALETFKIHFFHHRNGRGKEKKTNKRSKRGWKQEEEEICKMHFSMTLNDFSINTSFQLLGLFLEHKECL